MTGQAYNVSSQSLEAQNGNGQLDSPHAPISIRTAEITTPSDPSPGGTVSSPETRSRRQAVGRLRMPKPRAKRGDLTVELHTDPNLPTESDPVASHTTADQARSPEMEHTVPAHLRGHAYSLQVDHEKEVAPTRRRTAILYARLSRQRNKQDSIARQFEMGRCWAQKHNVEIKGEFFDIRSGKSRWGRLGLEAALDVVRAGGVDLLVVEEFARLARSLADGGTVYRLLRYHDVELISLYQGRANIVNLAQKMAEAEGYLNDTSRKMRDALRKKFFDGSFDGFVRYGYRHQRDEQGQKIPGKLEIDPATAPIAKWIFEAFDAGMSISSIVKHMNRKGILGPSGQHWTGSYIAGNRLHASMLTCETYMGWLVWERTTNQENPETGQTEGHRNERWNVRNAPHLKIVERDVWERVKRKLTAQRQKKSASKQAGLSKGYNKSETLLSGILRCAECGATMHVSYTRRLLSGQKSQSFKCSGYLKGRQGNPSVPVTCTRGRGINGVLVERAIIDALCSELEGPVPFATFVQRYEHRSRQLSRVKDTNGIRMLQDTISVNQKRIDAYEIAMQSPDWNVAYVGKRMSELLGENKVLEAKLVELRKEKPKLSFRKDRVEKYKTLTEAIRQSFPIEPKSGEELIAIASLKSLIKNVVVHDGSNYHDFRIEFDAFIGNMVADRGALHDEAQDGWIKLSKEVQSPPKWTNNKILSKKTPNVVLSSIHALPDAAWIALAPLFPHTKYARKFSPTIDRCALEHVLHKFRTGTQFKDMPEKGNLCISRLRKWHEQGTWPSIFKVLERDFPDLLVGFNHMAFESMFETDEFRANNVCQILHARGAPMTMRELWDAMIDRGVWPSQGDSGIYRFEAILRRSKRITSLRGYGYWLADAPLDAVNVNFHLTMLDRAMRNLRTAVREEQPDGSLSKTQDSGFRLFLTNPEWDAIKPLLPFPRNMPSGRCRHDDRVVASAIVHVLRSGIAWSRLPKCFGPWRSIHNRFNMWQKKGVIQKITDVLPAFGAVSWTS